METIALFGGSFDPPHIGHEAIVRAVLDLEYIDKVIIMPTFLNPFKSKSHASSKLRLKWLKEIFSSYNNVEISSYEVDLNKKVSSIQSVKHLLKRYKKVYLIIGADNLESLPKWDRYKELKKLVTFIIASRHKIELADSLLTLDIDVDVSSTQLRESMDISKLSKKCATQISQYYKETNATKN